MWNKLNTFFPQLSICSIPCFWVFFLSLSLAPHKYFLLPVLLKCNGMVRGSIPHSAFMSMVIDPCSTLEVFSSVIKSRCWVLPTMHCFEWDILNRWSYGLLVMKYVFRSHTNLASICFDINTDPHDHLYKTSHWKQCIVESMWYLAKYHDVIEKVT